MKSLVEEGWLMWAAIAVGIIILAIVIAFNQDAFAAIGKFFMDGVTGKVTETPGWGTK